MAEIANVLVVCVDRDNDLGRKTGIKGPVLGRKNVLNAAARLAVADPLESDANCMFAAVKKFDEIKKEEAHVEVCVLTGVDKTDYASDKQISLQLEQILIAFPAQGIVLVTNGAEDDQVIPILQSRAPIISKHNVIIRQAKEVESTFYTIKEALKDNTLKTMFVILPGTILLALAVLPSFSLSILSGGLGILLLFYGTGLYDQLGRWSESLKKSVSIQRTSFPFYLASFFILVFAIITTYTTYLTIQATIAADVVTTLVQSLQSAYFLIFLSAESFVIAKAIDAIHLRTAYKIQPLFVTGVSLFFIWLILDAGTSVFLKQTDINWFLSTILFSFVALLVALRATKSFDLRNKITDLLVGASVYTSHGEWVGKVEKAYPAKQLIEYKDTTGKQNFQVSLTQFHFREGKIFLNK